MPLQFSDGGSDQTTNIAAPPALRIRRAAKIHGRAGGRPWTWRTTVLRSLPQSLSAACIQGYQASTGLRRRRGTGRPSHRLHKVAHLVPRAGRADRRSVAGKKSLLAMKTMIHRSRRAGKGHEPPCRARRHPVTSLELARPASPRPPSGECGPGCRFRSHPTCRSVCPRSRAAAVHTPA